MQALQWLGVELIEVSFKEKLVSAIGSAIGIYCIFLITRTLLPTHATFGVVASMGATAVLVFAVPHGQLSQPWPVFSGHTLSALIGVCSAQTISDPVWATAIAVGLSIGLMHQLKCIHPPGGATAFTAVMGGEAIRELGFLYILIPVAANAAIMLILAVVINYPFHWRRYPAVLIKRNSVERNAEAEVSEEDHQSFIEAVRSLDSFVDASEEDILYLARTMMKHLS